MIIAPWLYKRMYLFLEINGNVFRIRVMMPVMSATGSTIMIIYNNSKYTLTHIDVYYCTLLTAL